MSHEAARDVAWFTRFARILPLLPGDFDPTQSEGVWLHCTRSRHTIGRGAPGRIDVSVRVDNSKGHVGIVHATITWDDRTNLAYIEDSSLNGTWVGGRRLKEAEKVELKHNVVVWLGPPRKEKASAFIFESFLAVDRWVRRWCLEVTLGSGAFGDVYQMRLREEPNRVYAVKVAHYSSDGQSGRPKAEVMQEVNTLRRVQDHPNICAFEEHHDCLERGAIFVVMPRQSTDLRSHFARRRPTIQEIRTSLKQILSAIAHMQVNRMVHRNIKPDNIFVTSTSPYLLAVGDFGLAYPVNLPSTGAPACLYRAGTVWYMPPEVVTDAPLEDPFKFDVFSAGTSISHLAMGEEAFHTGPWDIPYGSTDEQDYFDQRELRWDLMESANLPPPCQNVLYGLTHPDPSLRWSIQEALTFSWIADADDASGQALPPPVPTIPYIDVTSEREGNNASADPSTSPAGPQLDVATKRRSPRLANAMKNGDVEKDGRKNVGEGKKAREVLKKAELRGRPRRRAKVA
ncbi:unnamed protein product [Peniophora sp. CBMAI 1063]|nr:unnamed protein product [Peniophora sp. CBMAI 1063]